MKSIINKSVSKVTEYRIAFPHNNFAFSIYMGTLVIISYFSSKLIYTVYVFLIAFTGFPPFNSKICTRISSKIHMKLGMMGMKNSLISFNFN